MTKALRIFLVGGVVSAALAITAVAIILVGVFCGVSGAVLFGLIVGALAVLVAVTSMIAVVSASFEDLR